VSPRPRRHGCLAALICRGRTRLFAGCVRILAGATQGPRARARSAPPGPRGATESRASGRGRDSSTPLARIDRTLRSRRAHVCESRRGCSHDPVDRGGRNELAAESRFGGGFRLSRSSSSPPRTRCGQSLGDSRVAVSQHGGQRPVHDEVELRARPTRGAEPEAAARLALVLPYVSDRLRHAHIVGSPVASLPLRREAADGSGRRPRRPYGRRGRC
jgi:hypothetical protein